METLLNALKAVGEPTRLRVFALCTQGDLSVSELVQILGQSQPRVSRHLKLLCEAGLLQRLREGSWVFHRLSRDLELVHKLEEMIPFDDEIIARDLERLNDVKRERAEKAAEYFRLNANQWAEIRALHADDGEVEDALASALELKGSEDFLDIGTGTGRILEVFANNIKQGWGIDLSSEMLSLARTNLEAQSITNCSVRQGDMYQVPFAAHTFDIVTIYQVLHYADEPLRVIQEASRVLRDDGRLAIIDFAPHEEESLRSQHQHRRLGFAEDEISTLCSEAGLEVTQLRQIPGSPLTVSIWLAKKK